MLQTKSGGDLEASLEVYHMTVDIPRRPPSTIAPGTTRQDCRHRCFLLPSLPRQQQQPQW